MTQESSASLSDIAAQAGAWLDGNWDPELGLVEWRNKLVDSGWGMPEWPAQWYGRDFGAAEVRTVEQEFARRGVVGVARAGIRLLAAATLLEHGSEEQKQQFLRRILTGEDTWCQLFSEPGSGSDLAGSTTRAERDGDHWSVNGQKVWTTSAQHAHWGLLVARTDWEVPKHKGLSYFIIDMKQNGIDVQPLKQMNGHASFNQVFLTNALVRSEHLVGAVGDGWKVAMTTLSHERRRADGVRSGYADIGLQVEKSGRIFDEERDELATVMEPYSWYPQRAGRVDLAAPRAIESGRIEEPAVRQELARLLTMSASAEWTARRARAAQRLGKAQGPEGSLGKLAASHVARQASRVHTLIAGSDALFAGPQSVEDGIIAEILLSTPAVSIAGGTDEIQRNIIAERVLGMPKEARVDGGPFRDVPRNPTN
ncbi:MAG: acyl-CoA dehydrogenase family protein [Pseudomonadaceae bacterium]|nr:acyl-CoA dehydrogenase family protein [Pseudomonadaceae bacterium]